MKLIYFFIAVFILCSNICYSNIDTTKLRKPNPADSFDIILLRENKKLDAVIYKTDIWLSDVDPTQFYYGCGVIINKKNIFEKLSLIKLIDTSFLIRLILGHEKMHARQGIIYPERLHEEQLLLFEIEADMAAGFTALSEKHREYSKLVIRDLLISHGTENYPSFTQNAIEDSIFSIKLLSYENEAMSLYFSLGDNNNNGRYPNSYQRILSLEKGIQASISKEIATEIHNNKNTFDQSQLFFLKNNYDRALMENGNNPIGEPLYNGFFDSWSYWMSREIIHTSINTSKNVVFKLLNKYIDTISDLPFIHYQAQVFNKNNDSIKVSASVLLKANSIKDSIRFFKDKSLAKSTKTFFLAANEYKIIHDSIFDFSQFLDSTNTYLAFPGQLGSLYYTNYLNNKNNIKYFSKINSITTSTGSIEIPLKDLLNQLSLIQITFSNSEDDDFKFGVGFQTINSDEISYSNFIYNRPFKLVISEFKKNKSYLSSIIFQHERYATNKSILNSIYDTIKSSDNKIEKLKDNNNLEGLLIKNDLGEVLYTLMIKKNETFEKYEIQLKIFKTE
jgi:hypothetical protein